MGSACCVAARDKTILNGPHSDVLHRNIRYSPTWSIRWENRGRVAGEDTSISWISDGIGCNDGSEIKSPISEGTAGHMRTPTSDQSISRNASLDVSLEQVKESVEHSAVLYPSPAKLSPSLLSTSSVPTSPLSSQSHLLFPSTNTSRWPRHSPGHQLSRHVSDSRIMKSSDSCATNEETSMMPSWNNDSTKGSYDEFSDGWSLHAFSELMANSQRDRWSFDSESFGFNCERLTQSSSQFSGSPCVDLQSCGVCLKLLAEKSLRSSQKIIACNELSVVAVLTCGHVYHAECLENMTPEFDKYDPSCPVCILGEKQAHKLSQKTLKAGMELKAKHGKKSRRRIVDSELDGDSFNFDRIMGTVNELSSPKMAPSSSSKGKPFLRRHFSFSSKRSKSTSENGPTKKKNIKILFWTKSSKK